MKKFLFLFAALIFSAYHAEAQYSITGPGNYFQDFNSLGLAPQTWTDNSTLPNWWAQRSGTGTSIDTSKGANTAGNLYNYGPGGQSDRAIGSLGSGNAAAGDFAWGIQFQNNAGTPVTNITVTYVGEQWRKSGVTTPQVIGFYYKISSAPINKLQPDTNASWTAVTQLNFSSPVNTTTASALNGNDPANRITVGSYTISGLNIPAGHYIMLKWDDPDHSGTDHGLAIDSVAISWTVAATSVTTGVISGSPFCLSSLQNNPVSVPYTAAGTFNPGNEFKAYLSDAFGSFAAETEIGSLSSLTSGAISAVIPQGTPTGYQYRIRVKSTDPAFTAADNGSDLTVMSVVPDAFNLASAPGFSQVTLTWSNPPACYDEIMIVAKPFAMISSTPTGDGSQYTANSTDFSDPLNTTFDVSGKVVYKSSTPGTSVTITGLTNFTNYYFKFFARQGTDWSLGNEISDIPQGIADLVITEIMYYASAGTSDTLEYIEILNNDNVAVDLDGYTFDQGVVYTFPSYLLNPGEYILVSKDSLDMLDILGVTAFNWSSGGLNNTGEALVLKNGFGNTIDSVNYEVAAPWPLSSIRKSIQICNPSLDNNVGTNWSNATEIAGFLNAGDTIFGTPGTGCAVVVVLDTLPPVALQAYATALNEVKVIFNEPLDAFWSTDPFNYTFLNAVTSSVVLTPSGDTAVLSLSTPLVAGVYDTIFVTGVADTAWNTMLMTYSFPIVFGQQTTPFDTLVYWVFPTTPDNQIADGGIPANLSQTISRDASFTGSYTYPGGATTYSISSTGWASGANSKYWFVTVNTVGYDSIRFSSKQRSSATGPRNFSADFSLDGVSWTPIPNSNVTVAENFTNGLLSSVKIPDGANNKTNVFLRWVMANDTAVNGGTVVSTGTSRIDDILITGRLNPLVGTEPMDNISTHIVYPNPSTDKINIDYQGEAWYQVMTLTGQIIASDRFSNHTAIDISSFGQGIYLIRITDASDGTIHFSRFIKR
jgi:hypothetical protein